MDTSKLLTLGAVAVGGYFLYENFFATPAASTATTGATPTTGTTATGSPAATSTPSSGAPAATPSTYASICAGTQAAVSGSEDPNFTPSGGDFLGSPYHWQVYWNLQPGAPALDVNSMFSDTSAPVSGAAFCAAAQSYLAAHGLTGYLAGMGLYGMGDTSADINQAAADFIGSISTIDPLQSAYTNDYSVDGGMSPYTSTATNYTPLYLGLAAVGAILLFSGGRR